jgi:hypothetical protein
MSGFFKCLKELYSLLKIKSASSWCFLNSDCDKIQGVFRIKYLQRSSSLVPILCQMNSVRIHSPYLNNQTFCPNLEIQTPQEH